MKFIRYIIPSLLLCNSVAFADDGNSGNNSFFSLPVVAAIICYFRRKEAIGGWLLFYFFQLYYGAFNSLPVFIQGIGGGWFPTSFNSSSDYLMFLLIILPTNLCILSEVVISILLMQHQTRDKKYVKILLIVFAVDFLTSIISLPIDISNTDYVASFISFLHVLLSALWFFYFRTSNRVKLVFVDKKWDFNIFISLKSQKFQEPISEGAE